MEFTLTVIVAIYLCGLLAMVIELFVPGAIIGTTGFLAVLGSIIYALATGHTRAGVIMILCTLAFIPIFFAMWKGVVGRWFILEGDQRGFRPSRTIDESLVGQEGVAMSPLRPSGIARINDRRYDVVTDGQMVEVGSRVKVVEVTGNRVVVKRL